MSTAAVARAAAPAAPPDPSVADRSWFDRPALDVAADLLGMVVTHATPDGPIAARIVEVEAYRGPEDLAAHSARGRTRRNAVMFGPPGHLYVYLVYGMHHCANVVCGPGAKPEAVLLRAGEIVEGEHLALRRRGDVPARRLAAGPGNLARALGIGLELNGADLLGGPVRLAEGAAPAAVDRGPRIGVAYAGSWAARPYRLSIRDDRHRSRP
jgi:DNA-3-methyladenine glycosylase